MLIDQFISDLNNLGLRELINDIPNYVLVDIQNAADYHFMYNTEEIIDTYKVFTKCLSPWNKCLLKFKFPPYSYSKEEGKTLSKYRPDFFIACNTHKFKDGYVMALAYYGTKQKDNRFYPLGCTIHKFDKLGTVIPEYLDNGEGKINTIVDSSDPNYKFLSDLIATALAKTVLFAFTFCNCNNIIKKENHYSPELIKRRARDNKFPIKKYYTLEIAPSLSKQNQENKNLWKNSLHICRGHFKTFTSEKPLFGKVTGTYWWPMHIKGDEQIGVIEKDYELGIKDIPK